MRTAYQGQAAVSSMAPQVDDLMKVTNEELVLLSQVRAFAKVLIWQEAVAAEIARRTIDALTLNRDAIDQSTAALVEFKKESATASRRLETLTKVLIGLTVVLALLTVVLAVRDLTH
jgi:hypothetical protein